MSSIEERIQKHEKLYQKAENLCTKYSILIQKHADKAGFHKNAIDNLNKKKAKQEKKVD